MKDIYKAEKIERVVTQFDFKKKNAPKTTNRIRVFNEAFSQLTNKGTIQSQKALIFTFSSSFSLR